MLPTNRNIKENRNTGTTNGLGSSQPERLIRFISLSPNHAIDQIDVIKELIKTQEFNIDFFEFKVANTKIQKRLINLSQKDSPRQRVEIEEKVDVNTSYKHLRQLMWRIQKEIHNTFLLQMHQIKAVPCSMPLMFSSILPIWQYS